MTGIGGRWLAGGAAGLAGKVRRGYQRALFREQWYLLFDLGAGMATYFAGFRRLLPPPDRFWADPQVIQAGDRYYIFVEEYLFKARKGHIAVIEVDAAGNCRQPVRALERPYHLSYPFVFAWEGRYYMVPESAAHRTVELYECADFPHRWRFKRNLLEGVDAVDTTLLRHEGKWWLFTGMPGGGASLPMAQLHLFSAGDLLAGAWRPHPLNPIVPDPYTGRPAGGIVAREGCLFRPSQDCSRGYGYGFNLNEIRCLSETDYRETRFMTVRPDWDGRVLATHTFATAGGLTVIDAFARTPRFAPRSWRHAPEVA